MHAVVVTFSAPQEHLEAATSGIAENTRQLPQAPGIQHGYWTHDSKTDTMLAVVLFDREQQARASWAQAEPQARADL